MAGRRVQVPTTINKVLSTSPPPTTFIYMLAPDKLGGWYWESGFDRHPIDEMEYVRDWNFRAMYGAWDALKQWVRKPPKATGEHDAHDLAVAAVGVHAAEDSDQHGEQKVARPVIGLGRVGAAHDDEPGDG